MFSIRDDADLEGSSKRWVFGALGLALLFHLILAWALGWYKIPGLELPNSHSAVAGPFTVKRIEINPDALKAREDDPTAHMPQAEPPKNPSQFNLDPDLVNKALQTPQPALPTPSVPEPNKVIGATELSQGLPFAESDTANVTAEIAKVEPVSTSSQVTSTKLAEELINANAGPPQQGTLNGVPATADGTAANKLPGFSQLAPGFATTGPNLNSLPEPVLLRLPSDVLFDFDSSKLKPEADPLLAQAVALITKYPEASVTVDGYSDSFGKPDYNLNLSEERASEVQGWLQDHVAKLSYTFRSQGHGSSNYVVSPQGSIDQQQPNRRVEILIQALKQ